MRSEEKKQEPVPDPEELLSYTVDGTRTHVPSSELADHIPVRLRTLMCFVLNANYRKLFVNFKRKTLYPIRVHIYATYS